MKGSEFGLLTHFREVLIASSVGWAHLPLTQVMYVSVLSGEMILYLFKPL